MNVVIEGVVLVLLVVLLLLLLLLLLLELSEELLLLEEELLLLEEELLLLELSDFSYSTTPDFVPLSLQEEISNAVRHSDTTKLACLIIPSCLPLSPLQLNQPLVGCITTNYIPLFLAWIWLCVGV